MGVYVGKLYQIQTPRGVVAVEPTPIGVDDDLGLVSAPQRSDITRGHYSPRPKTGTAIPCSRVWYTRRRKGYEGAQWFHDLEDGARVVLDFSTRRPLAWFHAPRVEICKQTGAFLCG